MHHCPDSEPPLFELIKDDAAKVIECLPPKCRVYFRRTKWLELLFQKSLFLSVPCHLVGHDSVSASLFRGLPMYRTRNQNQIFHYTRCNTPRRVTSWRGPSPCHCARATQLLSKKCRNGGEPLATLCPIWPARDLNLRPPAPETNALPLDQLCNCIFQMWNFLCLRVLLHE